MAKISLTSDPGHRFGSVWLDDDVHRRVVVDTHPLMTIYRREIVDRSDDGDRMYEWEPMATDVHVAMYEEREVVVDGIVLMRVKVTALHQGEVDSSAALAMSFGPSHDPETVQLYRIEKLFQNGVRLEIEAERVLDG